MSLREGVQDFVLFSQNQTICKWPSHKDRKTGLCITGSRFPLHWTSYQIPSNLYVPLLALSSRLTSLPSSPFQSASGISWHALSKWTQSIVGKPHAVPARGVLQDGHTARTLAAQTQTQKAHECLWKGSLPEPKMSFLPRCHICTKEALLLFFFL